MLTVATVLAETGGFELFENIGQLVSYVGYDVVESQSGNRMGKTRISKKGNSRIRRILHMGAFNVVRFEQKPFLELYQRLYDRTRLKMKAYVAVQKKLLVLMYVLWKKKEAYCPGGKEKTNKDLPHASSNADGAHLDLKLCRSDKKVAPTSRATQDEIPTALAAEVLFQVMQN